MSETNSLQQRLELKSELDTALASGELTLERMRLIPPTATSIEHHTTIMKQLKAQETRIPHGADTVEAIAFLATKTTLQGQLYVNSAVGTQS